MRRDDHLAIAVEDVGIRYNLRLNPHLTLRRAAADFVRHPRSRRDRVFWALRDVTFSVRSGEILGIIGRNGAGKSTLLLAMTGILRPDAGMIRTSGAPTLLTRTAAMEGDLTGRENIYLGAAYLGFPREKVERIMDDIIDFAELGVFIDAPTRTYSSGMRARLGFSIAAHVEPEILFLDEVLGVGDPIFQQKCKARIVELMDRASAIVVVTHGMGFVKDTCTSALWLQDGKVAEHGEPSTVVERYLAVSAESKGAVRAVS
jgi:ABC-type polysaccharide/polyol phosphate transport system ATPase subunit